MEQLTQSTKTLQVAEIEIMYRPKIKASERVKVLTSHDCYQLLRDTWNPDTLELREEFKVVLLNRASRVLGIFTLSKGGIHNTLVDIKLIFAVALKAAASQILLAHNHPSGAVSPSIGDKIVTEKIKSAGALLEINVMDHIIVTSEGFYSFADEGEL